MVLCSYQVLHPILVHDNALPNFLFDQAAAVWRPPAPLGNTLGPLPGPVLLHPHPKKAERAKPQPKKGEKPLVYSHAVTCLFQWCAECLPAMHSKSLHAVLADLQTVDAALHPPLCLNSTNANPSQSQKQICLAFVHEGNWGFSGTMVIGG